MTNSTDATALARWLAGDFSNQAQAFENPPFFAHIRVCMRPVPIDLDAGLCLYLEQAYDYMLAQPYRIRVLSLVPQQNCIAIKNYTLQNPDQLVGAARDPDRLHQLAIADLKLMTGCNMITEWTGHSFTGRVEPGKACMVKRKGQTTYLDSEFEIDDKKLISYDRGRNPETDEMVWGSVAGPFQFDRWESFADEVIGPNPSLTTTASS